MKKFNWSLALVLAALLTVGRAMAVGDFEGEVDMKMTHEGSDKSTAMQYFVKGSKLKTQIDSPDGKFSGGGIYDLKTHQYIMVMDKQKIYMVSQLHPEKFTGGKDHNVTMHKTSNSENILGYNCQEWDYTSDNNSGKIWFAKGIGNWWGTSMMAQSDKLPASQKALVNLVISQKLFPMKYETTNKSGQAANTMVVTKVEKKSLSSSFFQPPAGYKKFDSDMLKNMGGGSQAQGGDPGQSGNKDMLSGVKPKLPF